MSRRWQAVALNAFAALVALVVLAGCTTFSRDGGFNTVSTTASERLGKEALFVRTEQDRDAVAQRTRDAVAGLLADVQARGDVALREVK